MPPSQGTYTPTPASQNYQSPSAMPAFIAAHPNPGGQIQTAPPTVGSGATPATAPVSKPATEPAVVSTQNGKAALDAATQKHAADMAAIQNGQQQKADTTTTANASSAAIDAVKARNGITADEAKAMGIDVTNTNAYSYDTNTGYYIPINQSSTTVDGITAASQKQVDDANTTFNGLMSSFSSAEQAIVQSLQADYANRMAAQGAVNSAQQADTNTQNIRNGTSRYASGVAGSIFTAQENDGLQKLNAIGNELQSKIAEADTNLQNKKYTAFIDNRNYIDKLNTEKTDALNRLQDQATAKANADRQYLLDVQKFNQTKDQDAFDNAFKTEQQKFDENYKSATLKLDRDKFNATLGPSGVNTGIPGSVSMTANNTPDPVAQQKILDGITTTYGPMTAEFVKGLVNYSLSPDDISSRVAKGQMTRVQAVALAKQLDPTYDDRQFATRSAYLKNLTSGQMSQGVLSANKSINHLIAFTDSVSKLNNHNVDAANAFNNKFTLDQNIRQNVKTGQTEGLGVADELAKFFKGTGASDVKSVDDWKSTLSTNVSPGEQKGVVQGAINLLAGQLDVMNQQYTSTMGKAPEGAILQPATIAKLSNLKNQGYTVDIPGVNYTDVNAFKKYDPDASDKLTQAYKDLQTQGIPTTPENILQAAQI